MVASGKSDVRTEELADWSQTLEDTIRHTNATYGPIAAVDEESGTLRLMRPETPTGSSVPAGPAVRVTARQLQGAPSQHGRM